jgi:hypothetical protein
MNYLININLPNRKIFKNIFWLYNNNFSNIIKLYFTLFYIIFGYKLIYIFFFILFQLLKIIFLFHILYIFI